MCLAVGMVVAGCHATAPKVISPPDRHAVRSENLVVESDFELPKDHPLIQDLVALRDRITRGLDLPPQREQVVVYLFSGELDYTKYLNVAHPGLPKRRAYFVGRPNDLVVYTYWGERIQEDLRHEYTHGVLHASLRAVPLWIDEGLAEYFEVVGPPGAPNTDYGVRLVTAISNGWRPDLRRLERMDKFEQMQRADYQEAWAWVHFMLHSSPETRDVLLGYLHDLRTESAPAPLSERLGSVLPQYEERFLAYVGSLHTMPPAGHAADATP